MPTFQYSTFKSWLMAIRPPTLLLGMSPVIMGLSWGMRSISDDDMEMTSAHFLAALLALILVILLQTAANLVNDAKDAEKGIDKGERLGPPRVVQLGLLSRTAVTRAYRMCFLVAMSLIVFFMGNSPDWLMLGVASSCVCGAYLYTGGPFPLAYYACGEVLALVFFGPIAVMGSSYLLRPVLDWEAGLWGLGTGLLSASLMAINNFRDRNGDRSAGKHTLATLLGADRGRFLPPLLAMASLGILGVFGSDRISPLFGFSLFLIMSSSYFLLIFPKVSGTSTQQNLALKRTAVFNLFYAVIFAFLVWV